MEIPKRYPQITRREAIEHVRRDFAHHTLTPVDFKHFHDPGTRHNLALLVFRVEAHEYDNTPLGPYTRWQIFEDGKPAAGGVVND